MPKILAGALAALFLAVAALNCTGQAPTPTTPAAARAPSAASAAPAPTPTVTISRVTAAEAKQLLASAADKTLLVDVRGTASYDEAHIAGAVNLPEVEVDRRFAELPANKTLLLY